tara:strand:- start:1899 stop:3179 length:1281 start_codon:yes stop_codon:yes gene_type:complete
MKKFLIVTILIFLKFCIAEAYDIKKINNAKTFSKTNFEANDTNLVDKEFAKNLLINVNELNAALIEEDKKIRKNNKDRRKVKFKGAEDIYKNFSSNVVYIGNRKKGRIEGIGSGIIVNHNGLKIITNWHVVDSAEQINVWLKPDKMVDENYLIYKVDSYSAKLLKVNKKKDLALLEVSLLPTSVSSINFGKYDDVKIGETLFAIGHPKGLLWSFNSGMVSQIRPKYNWNYKSSNHLANVIQIQVPINPGNSGGPLFNKNKELVGINTFTTEGENLNFAVAVDDVIEFLNEKTKPITKKKSKYIQKKKKGPTWIKKKKKKTSNENTIDLSNAVEKDLDGNGTIDAWGIDKNNNGIFELVYADSNEDGIIDIAAIDKNEDNNFEIILIDKDGNGNPEEAEIDENEDGKTDVIAFDYNEDGEWDKFEKV